MMSNDPIAFFDENGTAIFRASAIGNCDAALVYSLRGLEGAEPPESMLRRFEDGHLHEPAILDYLRKQGWQVGGGQETVSVQVSDSIIIRGHIDGIATWPADGVTAVIEAKSMSDAAYKKWIADGFGAFPKYAQQITVYMEALKLPALYAVKNKNNGEVNVRLIEKPPYLLAKLKAKAIRLVREAGSERTPACPKTFDYPCPYFALHEDRRGVEPAGDPAELDEGINELCGEYVAAKGNVKRWEEIAEEKRQGIIELLGGSSGAVSSLYSVEKTVVRGKRLDTRRLRAAFPDLSQFETESESVRVTVKVRGEGDS